MRTNKKRTGLTTASQTVLGLIVILLAMAAVSGGFIGLQGLFESLAYSVAVVIPLLLVVFVANRVVEEARTDKVVVAASLGEKPAASET